MTSASSISCTTSNPWRRRLPTTSSLSSTFIWQPTVSMYSFFVMGTFWSISSCGLRTGWRATQAAQFGLQCAEALFGLAARFGLRTPLFLGLAACFGLCRSLFLGLAACFGLGLGLIRAGVAFARRRIKYP